MDLEFYRRLRELALHNNVAAHRLVQWWESGSATYEEWSAAAILSLLEQNEVYLKAAIDAEARAAPRPMILPKERLCR